MVSFTVSDFVRQVADEYKSTQEMDFGSLSTYFSLYLFGLGTFCEAARAFPWSPSVSTLSKNLRKFSTNRFMRRMRAKILNKIKDGKIDVNDCCYAIDDTTVEKYGQNVFRVGSWGKHGGGMIRGQRIMTLVMVIRSKGIAIPLAFEICPKKDDAQYRSGLDISVELLDIIFASKFPKLPVVFDSWFDSVELMKKLSDRHIDFVIECKSNRKIKKNISPFARWYNWKNLFGKKARNSIKIDGTENSKSLRKRKYIAEGYVFLREHNARLKAAVVYNKLHGSNYFGIYVTNNQKMSCGEIWGLSRSRWHIEEFFRCIKQNLSFCKLATTCESSSYASICIPMGIYVKIILSKDFLSENSRITVGSFIANLKEAAFEKSLESITSNPKSKKILIFKKRRETARTNKKPVNPSANDIKEYFSHAA